MTDDDARRIAPRRTLPGGRAALGGLLVTLAAAGVFVSYAGATDTGGADIVVAATELRIGSVIEADDLQVLEGSLPAATRARSFRRIDDVVGRAVLGPIGQGEVVQFGAVTADRTTPGEVVHEVAVTLTRAQLAVGRLDEGDRVDLYVTWDEETSAVARGLRVVQLGSDGGSLTDDREVTVVVAAPTADVVAGIVHASRTGDVTLVRSTFARAEPVAPPGTATTSAG